MFPFYLVSAVYAVGLGNVLYFALTQAYAIRMLAIEEYGRVIHEFDPYFNYRATEYLWQHGWYKFRTWFDHQSWYPLGRPVGTTIYPGMQVSSVLIKKYVLPSWSINDICCFVPAWFGVLATLATAFLAYECSVGMHNNKNFSSEADSSSSKIKKKSTSSEATTTTTTTHNSNDPQDFTCILNHIPIVSHIYQATLVPIWNYLVQKWIDKMGAPYGLLGVYGSDGSTEYATPALEAAIVTALVMSMVPAHLMRSVGGGYDNESIAVFAMTFTFYAWVRSLRGWDQPNYGWAVVSGLAYFYMVAAWGGYVFVLNLIGVHASVLVAMGRYTKKLYVSYTLFYVIGTFLAIQVPVVGWTPLKSLEQMGPLLAFVIFQLLEVCQVLLRRSKKSGRETTRTDWYKVHLQVFGAAAVVAALVIAMLNAQGYFGPISSRVRGLFVKHTKTGNPLVDSVAEHQPANAGAYEQYLTKHVVEWCPLGLAFVAMFQLHDASSFLVVYGLAAYFFSNKMVRLILLTAPIASVLTGIFLSHVWCWGLTALLGRRPSLQSFFSMGSSTSSSTTPKKKKKKTEESSTTTTTTTTTTASKRGKNGKKSNSSKDKTDDDDLLDLTTPSTTTTAPTVVYSENLLLRLVRLLIFSYFVLIHKDKATDFYNNCHELSTHLSHPSIIQKGRTQDGRMVTIDDYREAYLWLRDKTPEDARILAWWDYGYQIAGIANRTTIADGNTWNHEHIALLGRTLTSSLKEGHRIARHLADYVLLWTGGGGDDVAKSPHMRRIANSVYRFLCPNDPTCRNFGMTQQGIPSPSMQQSLLFQLHSTGLVPGVDADKNRFKLVYQTKHGKVRIFKILSVSRESKEWVKNNRVCDAEGSWFCRGQYPPALQKILAEKKDFAQLEDFNRGGKDEDYTKQYLDNLNNPEKARQAAAQQQQQQQSGADSTTKRKKLRKLSQDEMSIMNNPEAWGNNEATTLVWDLIHKGDMKAFREVLVENPELAHLRSEDGRGPLWWAHEYQRENFVKLLVKLGVKEDLTDAKGMKPSDMSK